MCYCSHHAAPWSLCFFSRTTLLSLLQTHQVCSKSRPFWLTPPLGRRAFFLSSNRTYSERPSLTHLPKIILHAHSPCSFSVKQPSCVTLLPNSLVYLLLLCHLFSQSWMQHLWEQEPTLSCSPLDLLTLECIWCMKEEKPGKHITAFRRNN